MSMLIAWLLQVAKQDHYVLEEPPAASALGKVRLEALAALAAEHANDPRVGTPIKWMLHKVKHDRPDWVQTWMKIATETEDTPAEYLLRNLYIPDEAVALLILESLPHESRRVNLALLHALRWQAVVSFDVITSAAQQSPPLPRLAAWLNDTQDANLAAAILAVLGHWRAVPGEAAAILLNFLQRPGRIQDERVTAAAQHALARLVARDSDLRSRAQTLLEQSLPASAPALVRLLATQHKDAPALLDALAPHIPDPAVLLDALLEAGTDDDGWDDDYHGRLAAAVGAHAAAHPEALPALLARLRETLLGENWPPRRMALAAVAACIERFPAQVQNVAGGHRTLETLLLEGTQDVYDYDVRRFALSALSYLRAVTPRVVPVLLAALDENVAIVQRDAVQAAARFQRIEGDVQEILSQLTPHLHGPSAAQAYGVAKLLGALALSPAGEAADLRPAVIRALAEALQDPFSEQEVFIESESKGPLKETLYEELLRAAGWL